jgi:hypothetical protein
VVLRQKPPETARSAAIALSLAAALLVSFALPADARGFHGGHGFGGHGMGFGGHGMPGAQFAGDRRHGNDDYVKAASDERDKLLNTTIKSICLGC